MFNKFHSVHARISTDEREEMLDVSTYCIKTFKTIFYYMKMFINFNLFKMINKIMQRYKLFNMFKSNGLKLKKKKKHLTGSFCGVTMIV